MILLLWMKPSNSGAPAAGTIAAKLEPVTTFSPAATTTTFAPATTVRTFNA